MGVNFQYLALVAAPHPNPLPQAAEGAKRPAFCPLSKFAFGALRRHREWREAIHGHDLWTLRG